MMFSFFIVQETLYLYDKKRSAGMRTRHKGRWLPRQPRLGARMCQGTFFFILYGTSFLYDKNAPQAQDSTGY